MKFLLLSLWIGFLGLPLMGVKNALLLTIISLVGCFLLKWSINLTVSPIFQRRFSYIREKTTSFKKRVSSSSCFRDNNLSSYPLIILLLLLFIVPLFLNNYYIDVLTLAGIYVVLSSGLNIVVGLAGLLDLGYISFYGVGAYVYAILSTRLGISFWLGIPLGGLAAAISGIMLGIITLRLRGDYLAIVTLGFIHIVHLIMNNWDSVTNGPNGILNISPPQIGSFIFSEPIHFYYLILLIAIITVFTINRLNNSRIGRAWIAIREDEIAAEAMGVNTTQMKIIAFALGAAWAGIAGVFFAGKFAFISPESFTFFETVIVLSMVVLGGMGSIPGVIIGAVILIVLPETLREFQSYRMLFFGLALVVMMIFRPQGLIGNPRKSIKV
ncbi:MAG: branched-chain amino acid ABC transporter permease [Nitrospirota bacterium]